MRILFLTHAFNSLSQRLYVELARLGHEVSIEFDINDPVTTEAVELFKPHLIVAPYLRRAIPENIWKHYLCIVLHPGIKGDCGPSALDWAIMNEEKEWGITALQANEEMDAGDIWARVDFPIRPTRKSGLYRHEVTESAVTALLLIIERVGGGYKPEPLDYGKKEVRGRWRPLMKQEDRTIRWGADSTAVVLKKIRAADGFPGVIDTIFGQDYFLYNGYEEGSLQGPTGEILAQRNGAICRATVDGAVWITHLKKRMKKERSFKLPAAVLLEEHLRDVEESFMGIDSGAPQKTYKEIHYEEKNAVGYLHFDFYNGAMSTEQCRRLLDAYCDFRKRNTRVIVLMGGPDFWSNGIHLNMIEAAESPADESWRNINAMNDLARAIITTDSHLTISGMQGNSGGGGVFLAMASDRIYSRKGIVLNPHYKMMGNLYGSEYWTYLLPRRVGGKKSGELTENRLPIGAGEAVEIGLIDDCFGSDIFDFRERIRKIAEELAHSPKFEDILKRKNRRRVQDETTKPLDAYRAEEMEHMKLNFYGFDPSYHVARYNFVYKILHSRTPPHLAKHRKLKPVE